MDTVVKDVMTTGVITVDQDAPFAAIAAALGRHHVSAFPVLSPAGQVIGVVSEGDLLVKLALASGESGLPGMIGGILHPPGRDHSPRPGWPSTLWPMDGQSNPEA